MKGRKPKDPAIRQRTNKSPSRATLPAGGSGRKAPSLPKADAPWHDMTKAFWKATWESPMASEYLEADFPGLFRLAVLVDAFWKQPSVTLAAEIRQQQQAYGLTPLDRRRLEWTVERSESAAKKRDQSPGAEVPVTVKRGRKAKPADDPRQVLRAIK